MSGLIREFLGTVSKEEVKSAIQDTLNRYTQSASSAVENNKLGQTLETVSIISDPVFLYNVPNVTQQKAEFRYNYFTREERKLISESDANIKVISNDTENLDQDFLEKEQSLPRTVKITFQKPSMSTLTSMTEAEINLVKNADLNNIITQAAEGNLKNLMTGLELTDRGTEQSVIDKLKQSTLIIENRPLADSSYQDLAKSLKEIFDNPDGVTGEGKRVMIEKINATRSKNFALSAGENNEALTTDPVSNENFNLKINKLFLGDVIKYSNSQNAGIFEEELDSLKKYVNDIRTNALEGINVSGGVDSITERDQAIIAAPIAEVGPVNQNIPVADSMKLAGYLIEKTEQMPDETVMIRQTVFISNTDQLVHLDEKVRYGGKYIYKIRTVALFESEVIKIHPSSPMLDEAIIAKFLVASEGREVKIFCTENIPPKPPAAVRCRFNFKSKKTVLTWQFPLNKQRDIKRFQVFKRLSERSPFVLIAEYNFDNSLDPTGVKEIAQEKNLYNVDPKVPVLTHEDTTFNIDQKPIYALASVDAHGLTSNLSTQIQVEYAKYENRLYKKMFSREGAPKQYPNMYMNSDTFLDNIKVSSKNRAVVYFDPEYYKVFKYGNLEPNSDELDMLHIAADPNLSTYKMHIINLDQQKDKTVNIKIEDASTPLVTAGASIFDAFRYNNSSN